MIPKVQKMTIELRRQRMDPTAGDLVQLAGLSPAREQLIHQHLPLVLRTAEQIRGRRAYHVP